MFGSENIDEFDVVNATKRKSMTGLWIFWRI